MCDDNAIKLQTPYKASSCSGGGAQCACAVEQGGARLDAALRTTTT